MSDDRLTRRTALGLVGATAAAGAVSAPATAQENESGDESDESEDESDRRPIVLAGRTEYWYGIAPEEIEGEENPTLDLAEGEEYDLVWINVGGAEHELILESEDGEELEESDSSEEAGEAVSMTFEASEDAAEYYCEYHPEAMRGDVQLGEGFDLAPHEGNGTESNESVDENSSE